MSIIDNYEPVKYTGNGATKNFAFNFRGFDETYIKVRLEEIATGIQTLLTLTTDYTVTLDENTASGTVSLLVAPTSDYYIILTREMSYEQIVPYSNSRSFDAERIETSFDKNVALSQEKRERLNRGVTLPVGTTGINLTIPVPVANRCIKYNAAGDNLEVSNYDPDEQVAEAEAQAVISTTQAVIATTQAGNATASADLSESWAIDDIGDRPEGSSKYWAEQSALSVTGKANTDLSNLSATGQTILDGKINISDLIKLKSGFNIGSASTSTYTVNEGSCLSDDNTTWIKLSSSITKSISSFAVGSGNGSLDTGTIANVFYYIWLIYNPTTQVTDVLMSLSATTPTLPSGFTKKRRIGSLKTLSGNILLFTQRNGLVQYRNIIQDISGSITTTANRTLYNLTVPNGIDTIPSCEYCVSSTNSPYILITSPLQADLAPSVSLFDWGATYNTAAIAPSSSKRIITSNGQIGVRTSTAGALYVNTYGYLDLGV
ncbi:MAG: hypothetical protein BWY74_03218 [Firmicutes bacterium ADurb.Bin419]|nr:MAG: hypothetical protein BWY74_03218 [Firmicutes bacterium ADurb.Bin419]